MNMSKLSKLEKDLRSSAKLNKFQSLKLRGGDDKKKESMFGKSPVKPDVSLNKGLGD